MSAEILWLTPDTPENLSQGREQIAYHLRDRGYAVTCKPWSLADARAVLRADIAIGTTRMGAILASASVLNGTRFVVDHVDPIRQFYATSNTALAAGIDAAERVAFRAADHVLYVYDEESDRVPATATQTTLGLDYNLFANPPPGCVDAARKELTNRGIDDGFAVYIGGLEPIYNIQTLLRGAAMADRELVILGDGSLRGEVALASEANAGVHYLGTEAQPFVAGLLQHAGVGVNLADDGHTCKVLEYIAAFLPVVHADGRARGVLDGQVTFVDVDRAAVAAALDRDDLATGDQSYAQKRDWRRVADDYEAAL